MTQKTKYGAIDEIDGDDVDIQDGGRRVSGQDDLPEYHAEIRQHEDRQNASSPGRTVTNGRENQRHLRQV